MKNLFYGYYGPTEEEYQRLWSEALVVLDANVLLDMYRLPAMAREELITVLDSLNDRLWVPHQVGLEFQRNRLTVISAERKVTEGALKTAREFVKKLVDEVEALQLDKRGLEISTEPLVDGLNKANNELTKSIQKAHDSQLDISIEDPVRERLDVLLDGRVGPPPENQQELDALIQDGDVRYQHNIPPGFKDSDKEKNPNDAFFIFDNFKYQRKFGDLILWRQLINHSKKSEVKSVIFVTADLKEDWWWREQGKTVGPHPELVREIKREGGVGLFWMYTSAQFVKHANQYISAKVSTQSLEEIEQVNQFPRESINILVDDDAIMSNNLMRVGGIKKWIESASNEVVKKNNSAFYFLQWLRKRGVIASERKGEFPRILSEDEGYRDGYEIRLLKNFPEGPLELSIQITLLQGQLEVRRGGLSSFTIVLIIPEREFKRGLNGELLELGLMKIRELIDSKPEIRVIVGSIINDHFEVLMSDYGSVDNM